jgi:hypothetical protein
MGFNKTSNPFIEFIEQVVDDPDFDGIFQGDTYNAIHNAFVLKYITKEQLRKKGTDSLLWWPAMYNTSQMLAQAVLAKFKETASSKIDSIITAIKTAKGIALTRQKFLDVIYSGDAAVKIDKSNIKDAENLYAKVIELFEKTADVSRKVFRPDSEIAELLQVVKDINGIASTDENSKMDVTDKNIDTICKDILKSLDITSKFTEDAYKKIIAYIASNFEDPSKAIPTDVGITWADLKAISFSPTDIKALAKACKKINIDKVDSAKKIITGLTSIYKNKSGAGGSI